MERAGTGLGWMGWLEEFSALEPNVSLCGMWGGGRGQWLAPVLWVPMLESRVFCAVCSYQAFSSSSSTPPGDVRCFL